MPSRVWSDFGDLVSCTVRAAPALPFRHCPPQTSSSIACTDRACRTSFSASAIRSIDHASSFHAVHGSGDTIAPLELVLGPSSSPSLMTGVEISHKECADYWHMAPIRRANGPAQHALSGARSTADKACLELFTRCFSYHHRLDELTSRIPPAPDRAPQILLLHLQSPRIMSRRGDISPSSPSILTIHYDLGGSH